MSRYDVAMSAAFEVSPDDPHEVAEAIRRAAEGSTVHLVRDGQAVADIVPATVQRSGAKAQAAEISQKMADRFGTLPTLEHYRRVYQACGQPWPGDDLVRREHSVADSS